MKQPFLFDLQSNSAKQELFDRALLRKMRNALCLTTALLVGACAGTPQTGDISAAVPDAPPPAVEPQAAVTRAGSGEPPAASANSTLQAQARALAFAPVANNGADQPVAIPSAVLAAAQLSAPVQGAQRREISAPAGRLQANTSPASPTAAAAVAILPDQGSLPAQSPSQDEILARLRQLSAAARNTGAGEPAMPVSTPRLAVRVSPEEIMRRMRELSDRPKMAAGQGNPKSATFGALPAAITPASAGIPSRFLRKLESEALAPGKSALRAEGPQL